jgi:hypothetical protein
MRSTECDSGVIFVIFPLRLLLRTPGNLQIISYRVWNIYEVLLRVSCRRAFCTLHPYLILARIFELRDLRTQTEYVYICSSYSKGLFVMLFGKK